MSVCNNDIFIRFFMENGYRIFTMLRASLYYILYMEYHLYIIWSITYYTSNAR